MGPVVGRVIDALVPWYASLFAWVFLVCFQAIQTGAGGSSVSAVTISMIGLDVFRQMLQASLATAVLGISTDARARLNAVLILSLFIGHAMGTAVGTEVFVRYGWRAAAALNMGWYAWQLFILLIRGPHCERITWVGYEGSIEARKSVVEEWKKKLESGGSEVVPDTKTDLEAKSGDSNVLDHNES